MTSREVKRRLAEQNIRQVDLAKKWKLRPATVNMFIHGKFTSARLEKRLAEALGVTIMELRN